MLFDTPQPLQEFFQKVFRRHQMMDKVHHLYVQASVCAILLCTGRLTMQVIGSILPDFQRSKAAVSKIFRSSYFFTQEVAMQSALILCNSGYEQIPYRKKDVAWVLVLDTTHRSRFGKLLENLISNHKTSKKRSYAFIWPLLLSPTGIRISFPCPIWTTPGYSSKYSLAHKTQPQLATMFVKKLAKRFKQLNFNINLVVVADSAFESSGLWQACKKAKWTFITSCSADRCLGYNGNKFGRIYNKKVHNEMKSLSVCEPKKLDVQKLTNISLRSLQRPHCKRSGDVSHLYAYCQDKVVVSSIGPTSVVRSHKLKNRSQKLSETPQKVFLCNDLDLPAEKVIAYYCLRWQVETFFREQKSDLPFEQFQAYDHQACWKFVDLLSISFNFLESYRLQLLKNDSENQCLTYARTRELNRKLRHQVFAESFFWLAQRCQTPFGTKRAKKVLETLKLPQKNIIPLFR